MKSAVALEKIRLSMRTVSYTLGTGFTGSIIMIWLALQGASPNLYAIGGWFILNCVNLAIRYFLFVRMRKLSDADLLILGARAWQHTFVTGCVWGLAAWLFMPTLPFNHQIALGLIPLGLNLTVIPVMAHYKGSTTAFAIPSATPILYMLYQSNHDPIVPVAFLFILVCIYASGFVVKRMLDESIEVRLQHDAVLRNMEQRHQVLLSANHDFRQPLQSMALWVNTMMAEFSSNHKFNVQLRRIKKSLAMLRYLIDETMGFSKIAAARELQISAVYAPVISEKMQNYCEAKAHEKGLCLRVHDLDCTLLTDAYVVERVLVNLVVNAIRYTEKGGVLIAFRRRKEMCSIEVWDTGSGIPAEEKEKIFDEFYQVGNASKSAGENVGYGLGLAIVERLCERLEADLSFSSVVGKGSVFKFTVPIATGDIVCTEPEGDGLQAADSLSGLTIAVIEDDPDILDSLATALEGAGATVIAATDKSTLQHKLTGIERLDVLLSDLHLSFGVLGTDVAVEVKKLFPSVLTIILTAEARESAKSALRARGFVVLLKPIDMPTLAAEILSLNGHIPGAYT